MRRSSYLDEPRLENPRRKANCLSIITFWYTLKFFQIGSKPDFNEEDLTLPLPQHKSSNLGNKISIKWSQEVDKAVIDERMPSLWNVLFKCFWLEYALLGIMIVVMEFGVRMIQPFCIGLLIRYFNSKNNSNENTSRFPMYLWRIFYYWTPDQSRIIREEAFLYAGGIIFCSIFNVVVSHPYMMGANHLGMKIRVACCSLIYRKALRINLSNAGEKSVGNVVNLIANDVNRFDVATIHLHYLWIAPLQLLVMLYFMYREIQDSAIVGILTVIGVIPLQAFFGQLTIIFRNKTALLTDERVRRMNEIIQGIQVIKMYGWEYAFMEIINKCRQNEIRVLKYNSFIKGAMMSFIMFTSRGAVFLTVVSHIMNYKEITTEQVFFITGFYQIMRQTMTVFFPQGLSNTAETIVAVSRIRKFLLTDETDVGDPSPIDPYWRSKTHRMIYKKERDAERERLLLPRSIVIEGAWAKFEDTFCLENINLTIKPGELTACIGPVGSGKSCLLNLILGELLPCEGSAQTNGIVSYAAQEPWLFAGSVRQNILFGQDYDNTRYREVVKVCSLTRDFLLLPYGDATIVGEKGVSLSGGQRARVNLARAVYKIADIYLFDDPLSAVDTHVGQQLFDMCISKYLGSKIVLLITHQLQYLQKVKQILIMDQGKIVIKGNYEYLKASGVDFAKQLEAVEMVRSVSNDNTQSPKLQFGLSMDNLQLARVKSVIQEPEEIGEIRTLGKFESNVYKEYFQAGGNWCKITTMFLFFLGAQLFASGSDYFIVQWLHIEQGKNVPNIFKNLTRDDCILIYGFLITLTIIVALSRATFFFLTCMRASTNLHDRMFRSVVTATMRFFNTNPSGRILNRFAKDLGSVDEFLPNAMIDTLQLLLNLVGAILILTLINYFLLIPTFIVCILFYFIRKSYVKSCINIKRLEGITRSPVFSHLNASLQGLTTIRSHGQEMRLVHEFDKCQDLHSSAWFMYIATSRAFGYILDNICVLYITSITICILLLEKEFTSEEVGLAITQCIGLTGMFQWGMRQSAELENQMTSVERVLEFTKIEHEPSLESERSRRPPLGWPQKGKIEFKDVVLRYSINEPPILKNISCIILPKEKVGIVGRTGAGKSSLISTLFRLGYMEGEIIIDSINIMNLGLHDVRKKISIIPQEPVLFSGTLRYNLDPFNEYDDPSLMRALRAVESKAAMNQGTECLKTSVAAGGENVSVGQRQLICLARAMIRNNKILVMDEATANVDVRTDRMIQDTIRTIFKECTVLTIAHRLNTVMDADRILVMDAGRPVEFDHPHTLLQNPKGFLTSMVQGSGSQMADKLKGVAKESYLKTHPQAQTTSKATSKATKPK